MKNTGSLHGPTNSTWHSRDAYGSKLRWTAHTTGDGDWAYARVFLEVPVQRARFLSWLADSEDKTSHEQNLFALEADPIGFDQG